jgi:hypothetical protein
MTVIGRRRAESSAQWLAQHRRADARLGRGRRRVRDAGERCRVRASRRRAAAQQIALVARTIVPPTVTDDQALYERRALSMSGTRGRRELAFSGRLPLEQGVAFEQAIWHIAKTQRALDKQTGMLEWQQSAAVGLSTCAAYSGDQNLSFGLSESRRPPHLVGADPRQRCDDRKRPVIATCTRCKPRGNCRVLQRDLRALHRGAGGPAESQEPAPRTQWRPPGTFRRLPTCQGPRPPNQAPTTLGTPQRQVLAS